MKCLFVSNTIKENPQSGGEYGVLRDYKMVKDVFGEENVNTFCFETLGDNIRKAKLTKKVHLVFDILRGYLGGVSEKIEGEFIYELKDSKPDIVFFDTSQIGRLAKTVKKEMPNTKVITFFQNIETQYFMEFVKADGYSRIPLIVGAYLNEKNAINYSDFIITLNERDSNLLKKIFKRTADIEIPIGIFDELILEDVKRYSEDESKKLLFIGSNFYANYQGLEWFVKKVLDHIDSELIVIGKGTETWRNKLSHPKMKIIGTVECLSTFYNNSSAVVEPIFYGGGMKTKTAEALMYGKVIFGTKEAFEGYDITCDDYAYVCNSSEEFINKINSWFDNNNGSMFNSNARTLYLKKYDYKNNVNRLKRLLNSEGVLK